MKELVEMVVSRSREAAFGAIEGEATYQDEKWAGEASGGVHSIAEWTIYIEDYLAEMKKVLSRKPDSEAIPFARHAMRKIATMAVRCMEQNGVAYRVVEGSRPVGYSE